MGLFKSDTVQISHDISLVYSPTAGSQIIELVNNNPSQIRNKFGLGNVPGVANGLLDELRCYASISSLAGVSLPGIAPEDTESEKIMKVQSFEWSSARFELAIFKKAKGQADWAEFGVAALKNSSGFRYRIHRLLDLTTDNIGARIGEWGRIGVAIRSVGYGYPAAFDRITFTGHWVQEFTWVQERPTYVVINQYGNSPTPTPTPTPTPPPIPTLTLSLAGGSISAVANTDEKISLTTTNIPVGTELSGTWFKSGIDTGIIETVTATGEPILLSTLKLREKLSGSYSLRLFYNDNGYTSNAVAVTVIPEVEISPAIADTVNTANLIVTGRYFTGSNISYTYNWLKAGAVVFTSSGGAQSLPVANGVWTLSLPTSQLQNSTSGEHTFRANIVENNVSVPYNSKNAVALTVSTPPAITLTPTDVNTFYSEQTFTIKLERFTSGESLTCTFQRDGVDVPNTTETRTYTPTNNQMSYTKVRSYFYVNGAYGLYRVKVVRANGTTFFSNTANVYYTFQGGGEG